jgi:hypothetical protein
MGEFVAYNLFVGVGGVHGDCWFSWLPKVFVMIIMCS